MVRAGLADLALPDIPLEIAEAMRALWQAAVAVQLDDVVRQKREAQQAVDAAQAARAEAELRGALITPYWSARDLVTHAPRFCCRTCLSHKGVNHQSADILEVAARWCGAVQSGSASR